MARHASSEPPRLIGYFERRQHIKAGDREREISDPLTQSRLAAQKVREIERLDINDAKEWSEMDIGRLRPPAGRDERIGLSALTTIFLEASFKAVQRHRTPVQRDANRGALSSDFKNV